MPRRLLSTAAVGALLLGLAACGEGAGEGVSTPPPDLGIEAPSDGGGETEPSDGGGETDSEEQTAAAPDIPPPDPTDYAGMDEHSPEGAKQAARYFVAVTIWGMQTGNLDKHDAITTEECDVCQSHRETMAEMREAGEFWSDTTIEDVSISHDSESERYEIIVGYGARLSAHTEPGEPGGARNEVALLHQSFALGMDWVDGGWKVSGFTARAESGG